MTTRAPVRVPVQRGQRPDARLAAPGGRRRSRAARCSRGPCGGDLRASVDGHRVRPSGEHRRLHHAQAVEVELVDAPRRCSCTTICGSRRSSSRHQPTKMWPENSQSSGWSPTCSMAAASRTVVSRHVPGAIGRQHLARRADLLAARPSWRAGRCRRSPCLERRADRPAISSARSLAALIALGRRAAGPRAAGSPAPP